MAEPTCPECGYSLTGLKERKCPECGALLGRPRLFMRDDDEKTVRDSLRVPAIVSLVGLVVVCAFGARHGVGRVALEAGCFGVAAIGGTILVMGIEKLIEVDDAPWWLVGVRTAAAYGLTRIAAYWLFPVGSIAMGWGGWAPLVFIEFVAAAGVYWLFEENNAQDAGFRSIPIAALAIGLVPVASRFV